MDILFRTAIQSDGDPLEYVMSDETVDRYGDVISAAGWKLAEFKKNPIALFNHHSDMPVGSWENVRTENGRLVARLRLAAQGTSEFVDTIRNLVSQRILRACSVGFRALKKEPLKKDGDGDFGPFRFLECELVECSLVSVPANPNALQISKAFNLSAAEREMIFGVSASDHQRRPAGNRVPAKPPKPKPGVPMKISKQIEQAQAELNRMRDQLTDLSEKDERDEQEDILFEQLPDEIETGQKHLDNLKRAESALAIRVAETGNDDDPTAVQRATVIEPRRPFATPKKKVEPLDFLVRAAVVHFRAFLNKTSLEEAFAESYGNDEATMLVLRAVTNPAMTTVPTWAAELVQQGVGDFIDTLKNASIYAPLAGRGARFTFGRNGSIKIPGRAKTPNVAGSWVGEGAPKPVRRVSFTSITLLPYKLAVISTFTEEMAAYSTPQIEQVIRQAMADDTSQSLDTYLIDDTAGSAVRPPGLLNGVTPLTPSAESPPLAMGDDLKALAGAIVANGGGRDIVYLLNPVQAMSIGWQQTTTGDFIFDSAQDAANKLNATFIVSNTVPAETVIALDAADFATATGDTPRYSVSDQATIHEEDSNPLPIVAGGTPATPVRSLWQTDTIGIRMVLNVSWAMRRAGMVAYVENVTW